MTIPFVYLSARVPSTAASTKYCGVVLNTAAQYRDGVAALGVDPAGVWLVQNNNSEMAKAEFDQWPGLVGNTNRFGFFKTAAGAPLPNDASQYPAEVAKLRAVNPHGIVLSSDPFFRSTAPQLKAALATLNIPVCYPFKEFNPSGQDILLPDGAALSSVFYSDKANAYYQLGDRAAAVLDAASAANPVPPSQIGSVMWNGRDWIPF
jgi:hypothetical protein